MSPREVSQEHGRGANSTVKPAPKAQVLITPETSTNPLYAVREACRQVAAAAAHVQINAVNLSSYALTLKAVGIPPATTDPPDTYIGTPEDVVAYALTLDAINFGSGYSPQLERPRDASLYFTVASALRRRFEVHGGFSADDLIGLTVSDCSTLFDLPMEAKARQELTEAFCLALAELGAFVKKDFDGRFVNLVLSAARSAAHLVGTLTQMPRFNDVAVYRGLEIPFYKRAQLAVADLSIRLRHHSYGQFDDLDNLTAFADNAVPHVLRTHGVLMYDRDLASRIDAGVLLPAGSEEEVEIRACSVEAIERTVALLKVDGRQINSLAVDSYLWHRAHDPQYRLRARHLTRTAFY